MWAESCSKWRRRTVSQAVCLLLAILLCHLVGAPDASTLAPDAITGNPGLGRMLVFLPACVTAVVCGFMLPFSGARWLFFSILARREARRRRRAWVQSLGDSGCNFFTGGGRAQ